MTRRIKSHIAHAAPARSDTATRLPMPHCRRCNRSLKDPASVEAGMGAVCRAKSINMASTGIRCKYRVVKFNDTMVWIEDQNGALSVTNDAEAVCAALYSIYGHARIVYRDSMRNWDELRHDSGRFLGFAPAPQYALDNAQRRS